jgi:hypothetical protein
MVFRNNKDLKLILHPYIFVLKEGHTIQNDLLDYSLIMLQVNCHEIIKSPKTKESNEPAPPTDFEFFKSSISEALLKHQDIF